MGRTGGLFKRLLSFPHAFIFHREYYENGAGRAVRDEYEALRRRLSESQERELMHILSGTVETKGFRREHYRRLAADRSVDPLIRRVVQFHMMDIQDKPGMETCRQPPLFPELNPDPVMPEKDEIVEDAGLFDHEHIPEREGKRRSTCAGTADRSKAAN